MRLTTDTKLRAAGTRWRRHLARGLSFFVSLSLVAAVAPARSRDRATRGTRSAAARAANGSQRWDFYHDACELPLHITDGEWHASDVTAVSAGSPLDDGQSSSPFLVSADSTPGLQDAGPVCFETRRRPRGPIFAEAQSRAPPLSA